MLHVRACRIIYVPGILWAAVTFQERLCPPVYFLIVSLLLSCARNCREHQTIHCWLAGPASLGVHARHSNGLHDTEREDTCFLLTGRERSKETDVSMAQNARAAQEASGEAFL